MDFITEEFKQAAKALYPEGTENRPFDPERWQKTQGVTLRMLEWLCKKHVILLLVFHGDTHVTRMRPDEWTPNK